MRKNVSIKTARLTLRNWLPEDREHFALLNSDPEVMRDLGGPLDRAKSDAKFDRYVGAFEGRGLSRWALEDAEGRFLGYAGAIHSGSADHPLGPHVEIGWRLAHWAWGNGYATEAAKAALDDAFARQELHEVLSYSSPDNPRSCAVMVRIGMKRDAARDFIWGGKWHGLVWVAKP